MRSLRVLVAGVSVGLAFTRRHPFALLSGGRYDSLYPALGRPFGACGFALHLDRLLEVERRRPAGPGTEGGV